MEHFSNIFVYNMLESSQMRLILKNRFSGMMPEECQIRILYL